jgi:tRNA 2-thiouridine synthesizing protein A
MTAEILDLKGLKCPLPVLKAKKRFKQFDQGTSVTILSTDPMARIDIPHFCKEDGHQLTDVRDLSDCVAFHVVVGANSGQ